MSQDDERESNPIDVLPPALLRAVFALVPADQRARAACVCRGWRAFLADPSLWLRLDLSCESGATCRLDGAALLAAAARAQGRLEVLTVNWQLSNEAFAALHDVAAANAASLRELRRPCFFAEYYINMSLGLAELQALLAAAPALEILETAVSCDCVAACRLLRNEHPFGPLRIRSISVVRGVSDADFRAMVAELTTQRFLTGLQVSVDVDEAPLSTDQLGLVFDAALTAPFKRLQFTDCGLTPAAAPALARLLSSAALTSLNVGITDFYETFLDAPGYALFGDALRVNCTLLSLCLKGIIWLDVAAEDPALFGALAGHVSLRIVDLDDCYLGVAEDAYEHLAGADLEAALGIVGSAIGLLVVADAPALEVLRVSFHESVTDVFGPLADALPLNTHLLRLYLWSGNLGAAFTQQRLLPALRANTSLREFFVEALDATIAEAVQFVASREAARVAAEALAAASIA
jgi:hypothetical protein